MKTVKTGQQPASEKKNDHLTMTVIINTVAIFVMGALVLILRDKLKSDLANILLFIMISYFLGQVSAVLILHSGKKNSQATVGSVQTPPGEYNAGEQREITK